MSEHPLSGQHALITGGSRGIGFALAEALASEGCHVALAGRDMASLNAAYSKLEHYGTGIVLLQCDVRREDDVKRAFEELDECFPSLEILINNAGVAHALAPIEKTLLETWNEVMETNVTGTFLVTRAALPMMSAGASIVNNLSISAYRTFPNFSAYTTAKQAALGFTNALREEVRERGIRVMALVPGATNTAIWDQFWPEAPHEKLIMPCDVASAVVNALKMPAGTSVEEIRIMPTAGSL